MKQQPTEFSEVSGSFTTSLASLAHLHNESGEQQLKVNPKKKKP
jgi:hypothetical protein